MSHQDSPFAALDKMLLSSPQAKKPGSGAGEGGLQNNQSDNQRSDSSNRPFSPQQQITEQERRHETTPPRNHDATVSWSQDEIFDHVRKAVKQLGKEAATHRFTQEEKRALAEIVYTYKGQGIRTSENEITRISINYLLTDYHQNGATSILAQILDRLNA